MKIMIMMGNVAMIVERRERNQTILENGEPIDMKEIDAEIDDGTLMEWEENGK